ncbi:hypothetical protein D9M70_572230 [compost metagenome]
MQVERGHLVDGRLPVAGGHHGQDISALDKGAHPGELAVPEPGEPEGVGGQLAEAGVGVCLFVRGGAGVSA